MIAHSNPKITNIDEAISACENYVELCGVLSELNVDIINRGEKVIVKYKGVVDVNDAFIKIYGNTNNNLLTFNSVINALKSLCAEIVTISNNGEIVKTQYNQKASLVYLKGKLVSMESIKVDYINVAPLNMSSNINFIQLNGWVEDFDKENNWIKLFIMNNNYHQKIDVNIDSDTFWDDIEIGNVICCGLNIQPYSWGYPPIHCVDFYTTLIEIDQDVVNQAQQEYEIYQHTLEQNYGKS